MHVFVWALLSGTLLLFFLAAAFIFFLLRCVVRMSRHQEEATAKAREHHLQLLQTAIATQEAERKRIAADLHDELSPLLALIAWYIVEESDSEGHFQNEKLSRARQLLSLAMTQVKEISYDMAPYGLEQSGLEGAIRRLLERMDVSQQLKISVSFHFPKLRLPLVQEVMIFRILQELFNNIQKHSSASFIHIIQHYAEGVYRLFIEHDGKGLVQESFESLRKQPAFIGLQNIHSRLQTAGGNIRFTEHNGLFTTTIQIALAGSQHQ